MATPEVPDFLTVEEAAAVLRIGRTAAYQQARLWLDTDGPEGLPVRKVGGLLRVPWARFEEVYNIQITAIPAPRRNAGGTKRKTARRGPAQDIPRSTPTTDRRRNRGAPTQGGLPFAG